MPETKLKLKILIVRFSSIGDIVLTSPVIRILKKHYPDCIIHYITKEKFVSLINADPSVEKVFSLKNSLKEVISLLRKEKYDLIVDLHRNFRSYRLTFALHRKTVRFAKLNLRKYCAVRLKKLSFLPDVHIAERYVAALPIQNVSYDGKGLYFYIPPRTILPKQLTSFIEAHKVYMVFAIGGTYFTKRCPVSKVVEICQLLNVPVVLIGGEQDRINAAEIQDKLGTNCYNASGALTVSESAMLMQQCRLVISNDTGMMHIAAALKMPVVSLWGNTIPRFGMYPLLPEEYNHQPAIIQVEGLPCRPCSKLGYHRCPKGHFKCMNELDVKQIASYVAENQLFV